MTQAIPSQARYALGRHVFVCVCGQDYVLLDLARDKYLALDSPRAAGLGAWISGWPAGARAQELAAPDDSRSLADALLNRGLLTPDLAAGRDATPISVPELTTELTADVFGARPRVRLRDAATILAAVAVGKFLRRRRSIEHIVERARHRKERAGFVAHELDLEKAQRLIAAFGAMRSFLLQTRNVCLLECIVLLELFAHYDLFPTWVFGVHARPFGAHCWLQHEHIVLNDTLDHVSQYTPIMTV